MNTIFLPTIQNTGTWFMMRFLLDHPSVDGYFEIPNLNLMTERVEPGTYILHTHTHAWEGGSEVLPKEEGTRYDEDLFWALAFSAPTITTIRDPLRGLLTLRYRARAKRHESEDLVRDRCLWVLGCWDQMSRTFSALRKHNRICLFPIDLLNNFASRLYYLDEVLHTCQMPNEDHTGKWARDWPMINSIAEEGGVKEEYARYDHGDWRYFRKVMPIVWEYFKKIEPTVRPFLTSLGYRDLMWYT